MKSEEQKYWMEHYPHEAETIITLCDLFDEAQDEATKAQINYAIGVLRKKEKYRWHDLRTNPEDLPDANVGKRIMIYEPNDFYKCKYYCLETKDILNSPRHKAEIAKWRYIELSEEDNE